MEGNISPFPWMLGCALFLWLCWWYLLPCLAPQRAVVSAGVAWESQKGFCVSPSSEVLGIPRTLSELGSWKVEAEVAAAIRTRRRWSGGWDCTLDLVPMLHSSFTLVGLSAFLDPGQHFPRHAPGDWCVLSWLCQALSPFWVWYALSTWKCWKLFLPFRAIDLKKRLSSPAFCFRNVCVPLCECFTRLDWLCPRILYGYCLYKYNKYFMSQYWLNENNLEKEESLNNMCMDLYANCC